LKRAIDLVTRRDNQILELEKLVQQFHVFNSVTNERKYQILKEIDEIKKLTSDELNIIEKWEVKRARLIAEEQERIIKTMEAMKWIPKEYRSSQTKLRLNSKSHLGSLETLPPVERLSTIQGKQILGDSNLEN
jgi:hypothetical protein